MKRVLDYAPIFIALVFVVFSSSWAKKTDLSRLRQVQPEEKVKIKRGMTLERIVEIVRSMFVASLKTPHWINR